MLPLRKGKFEMDEQRGRILVIDDEESLRSMLRRVLGPEHDVTVVARAQEALDLFARGEHYDLILCDLMLPRVTGMDFHALVGPIAPELVRRIVYITGGAYTDRARAFIERSDVRHIEKPFASLNDLRATVRKLLASTKQEREKAE